MICPALFKQMFLPACCFFLLPNNALSQTNQSDLRLGFWHEIGLDFAPFVRGQQGISLLYKHKIESVAGGKWHKQDVLRALAGFYTDPINANDFSYRRGDTLFVRNSVGDAKRYFISVGAERQYDQKKFRFSFGGEIGYRGSIYKPDIRVDATVNGTPISSDLSQGKVTSRAPEVGVFGGCHFFILPRFSIGLELCCSFGIDFSTSSIIRNGQVTSSNDSRSYYLGPNNLLRLLYLGYHF